jgi:hypothetical protein
MSQNSFDDVGGRAQFLGPLLEMLPARTGTIEHFLGRNVVRRATDGPVGINVQVGERGILLPGLVVGQRIIHDRVLRDFGQRDVMGDVVQIGAVVLPRSKNSEKSACTDLGNLC